MVTRRRSAPPSTATPKTKAARIPAEDRRARFIDEYLIDLNATQAALRSGYSPATAYSQGSRLLKVAEVAAEIDRRVQRREEQRRAAERKVLDRYEITHDRIKGELARLAFGNVMDFGRVTDDGTFAFDMSATTRDEAAALKSLKTKRTRRTVGRGEDATIIEDVETSFQLADKRSALVDLGKATGLFSDGPDISAPVTFVVEWSKPPPKSGDAT